MAEPVRVASLAHEVKSLLDGEGVASEKDRRILEEASSFLQDAREGGEKLANRDFNAALAKQVKAFGWMAKVFAVTQRENANSSEEVAQLIGGLLVILSAFAEGNPVPEQERKRASQFFATLRDMVLDTQRQLPRPPELRGVA